jgi:hypothetical protein
MSQDHQEKQKQGENYDLILVENGKSEASQLYKGPPTRFCRIEKIEFLEGDRQMRSLPVPAIVGNNMNSNLEGCGACC